MSGLYARIRNNNARSLALFGLFFLAAEALTVLMVATLLAEGAWRSTASISPVLWVRTVFLASWTGRAWLFHFSGYVCWFVVAWAFYRTVVKRSLDLRPLNRAEDPVAYDIAEATALAAGLRMPRLYVMESVGGNAFAFGLSPIDASIVLSRGLLRALNAPELEAVIAHEIAHIRGRDIRLMAAATLCAGVLFRIAWVQIAMVIQPSPQWLFLPIFAARFFWGVLGLALWSCAAIGVCVVMARLAISNAREFKADAEAVDLTGNPEALISALRKLDGAADIPSADFAVSAAMIVAPRPTLLSAHPPIGDRIAALRALFPRDAVEPMPPFLDQPVFSRAAAATVATRREFGLRRTPGATSEPPAGWSGLVAELSTIRPPKWVSHPYILLPAIALNLCVDFAFGSKTVDFAPLPSPASMLAPASPRPRLMMKGTALVNPNAPEFKDPSTPLR